MVIFSEHLPKARYNSDFQFCLLFHIWFASMLFNSFRCIFPYFWFIFLFAIFMCIAIYMYLPFGLPNSSYLHWSVTSVTNVTIYNRNLYCNFKLYYSHCHYLPINIKTIVLWYFSNKKIHVSKINSERLYHKDMKPTTTRGNAVLERYLVKSS